MNYQPTQATQLGDHFELRFCSLFNPGRALSFPCDRAGQVNFDDLSDHARTNYLYARAMMGREYAYPTVITSTATH